MNEEPKMDQELEQQLRQAFAAHRVDPQRFRAGIQARVERASREPATAPAAWSRAAALLPWELPLQASSGFWLTLAVPVLGLAACAAVFGQGLHALRRRTQPSVGPQWAGHWGLFASLLVLWLALLVWGESLAIDLLLWILVLSMSACVLVLRQVFAQGQADRTQVARLVTQVLSALLMSCFLWLALSAFPIADTSHFGLGLASCVVLVGIPLCWWRAGHTARALLTALLLGGVALFFNLPGCTHSSRSSGQAQLAQIEAKLDPDQLRGWEAAAAWHQALQASGVQPAPALEVRAALAQALAQGKALHPTIWTSAEQLGLMDATLWQALAQQPSQQHALDQLVRHGVLNATPYYQYLVPMLVATRTLSASERTRVIQSLLAQWPQPGEWGALPRAQACLASLERLEARSEIAALEQRVPELLRAHWVSPAERGLLLPAGGFSPDKQQIQTGMDDDTLAALALLARVDVPQPIDLYLVHAALRRESRAPLWVPPTYLSAKSRAGLLRLREGLGLPPRTLLESILAERVLWAALCLVALCWLAVGLAPRQVAAPERGAAL